MLCEKGDVVGDGVFGVSCAPPDDCLDRRRYRRPELVVPALGAGQIGVRPLHAPILDLVDESEHRENTGKGRRWRCRQRPTGGYGDSALNSGDAWGGALLHGLISRAHLSAVQHCHCNARNAYWPRILLALDRARILSLTIPATLSNVGTHVKVSADLGHAPPLPQYCKHSPLT